MCMPRKAQNTSMGELRRLLYVHTLYMGVLVLESLPTLILPV